MMGGDNGRTWIRPGRTVHVAVLQRDGVDAILSGEKEVEARLSKTAAPPFGKVHRGDRIFLKQASGPFRATAKVGRVVSLDHLSEEDVEKLRERYNDVILGPDDYWEDKRGARYATLIWLRRIEETDEAPEGYVPKPRASWHVIDEEE